MTVVDSSVILKSFLSWEVGADAAFQLLKQHSAGEEMLTAPDLLAYEISNVLTCKSLLSLEKLKEGLVELFSYEISLVRFELEDCLSSAELARRFQLSLYDASYVHLAQKLGCDLITADEKLHQKTKSLPCVRLLG